MAVLVVHGRAERLASSDPVWRGRSATTIRLYANPKFHLRYLGPESTSTQTPGGSKR